MNKDIELMRCDENADLAIKVMMGGIATAAIIPGYVNWALIASAMGVGCAAIGKSYGFNMNKDEGWMLTKQFLIGAGTCYLALGLCVKFFSGLLDFTGPGCLIGRIADAAFCSASAWAIGGCAKSYFRSMALGKKRPPSDFGKEFREMYNAFKSGKVKIDD